MWRDLETVQTPDLPAALAHQKAAQDAVNAARQAATDALARWNAQQDRQDRSHVTAAHVPRSEYRLKPSKDGLSMTVQTRPWGDQ